MPPLRHPKERVKVNLPPRTALLASETDVLVVGGGPAGLGAALGAADAGANVILAERYGFLGGNATAALVMPLMSFYTENPKEKETTPNEFFPSDHGLGEPVIAGAVKNFLDRLIRSAGAISPSVQTGFTVPFDPEIFKWTALEMLDDAGVLFLFHAFASDVIVQDQKIQGVVFETKSGPIVIRANVVVDCTGDGDIAAQAGAPFEIGRDKDHLVQPMTLMFRMGEFEKTAFQNYIREHPDQWRGVHGLWELIRQAASRGELRLPREDILFFETLHEREIAVNSTRVNRLLGSDVWDWTYAEWESRAQMRQVTFFLKKYVPGFEKSYILQSGVHTGVRETRRILGEYKLTASDILNARKSDDVIACSTYPMDIHNPEGAGTVIKRVPAGDHYEIPLRCLIPLEIDQLVVAGRCISGTHEALSSYRVMPVSMATGQAAGVCAALSAKTGRAPRVIPAADVQSELLRQGAQLGKKIST